MFMKYLFGEGAGFLSKTFKPTAFDNAHDAIYPGNSQIQEPETRDENWGRRGRYVCSGEEERSTKNLLFIEFVDEQQNDGVNDQFYRSIVIERIKKYRCVRRNRTYHLTCLNDPAFFHIMKFTHRCYSDIIARIGI